MIEIQFTNRFTFFIVIWSIIGSISSFYMNDIENWRKFFTCLPLLKLLVINKASRHLLWCLCLIIPMFINLLVFLFVIYLIFATYGVYFFATKFTILDYSGEAPPGDFENLKNGMFVLFQLLVGEEWHEVSYAAIKTNGWNASYYFISFTIIVSLLFTNLFVGIILSVYQVAEPLEQPTYLSIMKKRQEELQILEEDEEE